MLAWKKFEGAREEMVVSSTTKDHEDNNAMVVECDPGLTMPLLRSEICSQIRRVEDFTSSAKLCEEVKSENES